MVGYRVFRMIPSGHFKLVFFWSNRGASQAFGGVLIYYSMAVF